MSVKIEVIEADITGLAVDAIVNAANSRMLGGGGVDGAIHRAAGPELKEECKRVAEVSPGVRCPTGEARLTKGYELPAKYVIHTVGPVWQGGAYREAELLASCYRNALELARENGIKSIAFPAISTGIFGYPTKQAAEVAARAVREWLGKNPGAMKRVVFACFGEEAREAYEKVLRTGD